MKAILVTVFVLIGVNYGSAGNEPKLFKEINRKTILDIRNIKLDKEKPAYVEVEFTVVDKKLSILSTKASLDELGDLLTSKLEEIVLNGTYDPGKNYRYRFVFEKE